MRVSDAERQVAAERLRGALAEGRLDFLEYDHRLAKAFEAVTYADLDKLFGDLPVSGKASSAPAVAASPSPPAVARPVPAVRTGFGGLPPALKVLWTIWTLSVLINLTVWLLVSLGVDEPVYFWPMWFAVPGVVLGIGTAITMRVRNSR